MKDTGIKKASDLENFGHKEYIEVDSCGWHLKPDAPPTVKKEFEEYMNYINQGKKEIYFGQKYDSKKRFISYWHQINEVRKLDTKSILVIGVGNKFLSNYLLKRNYKVTTLDHNITLEPDLMASVLGIPLTNNAFATVACYEVLEHMPFEQFKTSLREINRVCEKYALISLPDKSELLSVYFNVPILGEIKKSLNIILPNFLKSEATDPDYVRGHYWSIGKKGYSLKKVKNEIKKSGFKIKRTFRPFFVFRHRFFILEKVG